MQIVVGYALAREAKFLGIFVGTTRLAGPVGSHHCWVYAGSADYYKFWSQYICKYVVVQYDGCCYNLHCYSTLFKAENRGIQLLHSGPLNSLTPIVRQHLKQIGFRTQAVALSQVYLAIRARTAFRTSKVFHSLVARLQHLFNDEDYVFNWAPDTVKWRRCGLI
jgi:hypothetical protein